MAIRTKFGFVIIGSALSNDIMEPIAALSLSTAPLDESFRHFREVEEAVHEVPKDSADILAHFISNGLIKRISLLNLQQASPPSKNHDPGVKFGTGHEMP